MYSASWCGKITFRLLFHQHYPAGDDLHRGDNTDPVPAVPLYQPQTGKEMEKRRDTTIV